VNPRKGRGTPHQRTSSNEGILEESRGDEEDVRINREQNNLKFTKEFRLQREQQQKTFDYVWLLKLQEAYR